MFFQRKKSGRPVAGRRLDQDLPPDDWTTPILAFHANACRTVSVVIADDEATLDPFPIIDPGPLKFKPN